MKSKVLNSGISVSSTWLTPSKDLALEFDTAHIWRASLDLNDSLLKKLFITLSTEERRRSEKYHYRRDQRYFIAARGILRNILSRYLRTEPEEIVFSYGPHGKPFLSDPFKNKKISFNLSHAQNLAMYAVTINRRLGIDIEYVQQEFQWKEIVERFFSPDEHAELCNLPEKERCRTFFSYWTRKEAVLKAIGTGLSNGIKEMNVAPKTLSSACLSKAGYPQSISNVWELIDLDPGPGFAGALAVEGEDLGIKCWQWN
jgi:4'-phosphopantetheinyl transferase